MIKRFVVVSAAVLFVAAAAVRGQSTGAARSQQSPPAQQPAAASQLQGQRPPQPPLGPSEWRIDRSHSAASFSVRHNVVSTVRGQLGPITGRIEYDGKDVRSITADVTIDVTAINTGNQGRDTDLRSDNFFNTAQFPNMTFKSKRVEPVSEGRFRLVGDLTIRDKTNEVVLDVEGPSPVVKGPRGVLTGASATTRFSRQAFGVLWNRMIESMPVVGDEVTVTIDLELTRPAMPGATQ